YIFPTLYLVLPSAPRYPLLRLLQDCNDPQRPHQRPHSCATQTGGSHRLPKSHEGKTQPTPTQCGPWTVTATPYSVELSLTQEGTTITVKLSLSCI
ncbi:E4, partial [Macaca fascicularis papillomavirus 7]